MKGYLVHPADQSGKLGTVIVIHENRGLNPHIRDVARRVALEGFVALAPDFLSPLGGTPADEDKARDMFDQLEPAQVVADGVATVAFLERPRARQRQGRRGRLLLGRRHGQRPCGQRARPRRRRRLLRPPAEGRGRRQDQGAAAAALCRARRAHQCRHRRLQGGADQGRQGVHRSTSMTASTTPSTTTRRRPATTRRRPISPGAGRSRSSRRSWRDRRGQALERLPRKTATPSGSTSTPMAAFRTAGCRWCSGAAGCRVKRANGAAAGALFRRNGWQGTWVYQRLAVLAFPHARARGAGLRLRPGADRLRRRQRHQGRCRDRRRLRHPGRRRPHQARWRQPISGWPAAIRRGSRATSSDRATSTTRRSPARSRALALPETDPISGGADGVVAIWREVETARD